MTADDTLQLRLDDETIRFHRARNVERLIALVQRMAIDAGPRGVCAFDLRDEAERTGLLIPEPRGRELAYIGAVMRKARLVRTGEFRRSPRPGAHQNLNAVWVAPRYAAGAP